VEVCESRCRDEAVALTLTATLAEGAMKKLDMRWSGALETEADEEEEADSGSAPVTRSGFSGVACACGASCADPADAEEVPDAIFKEGAPRAFIRSEETALAGEVPDFFAG
jgi:hypothetical protein